jgi:hypothetical protein
MMLLKYPFMLILLFSVKKKGWYLDPVNFLDDYQFPESGWHIESQPEALPRTASVYFSVKKPPVLKY